MDPHIYSQLILNQSSKAVQWRKDNLFNKWCWNNGYPYAKESIVHTLPLTQKLTPNES